MRKFWLLPLLFILASVELSACAAIRQVSAPTPTLDTAHWKVYQDLEHHFSFEYPKSFDDRSLCALKVKQASVSSPTSSVSMNNSDLKVSLDPLVDPKDTDPQTAADDFRNYWSQTPRITFDKPLKMTVAGVPAAALRYHTAYSKDGYLENVFFKKNGVLYTIALNTPATCDGYPDTPTAVEAFQRILTSFRIQ